MNKYRYKFKSKCPNNGRVITYRLSITSNRMIQVEHVMLACSLHESAYHEDIAAALYKRFGGLVVLKAHHHGVDIKTTLGSPCHIPEPVVFVETNFA